MTNPPEGRNPPRIPKSDEPFRENHTTATRLPWPGRERYRRGDRRGSG